MKCCIHLLSQLPTVLRNVPANVQQLQAPGPRFFKRVCLRGAASFLGFGPKLSLEVSNHSNYIALLALVQQRWVYRQTFPEVDLKRVVLMCSAWKRATIATQAMTPPGTGDAGGRTSHSLLYPFPPRLHEWARGWKWFKAQMVDACWRCFKGQNNLK